MNRTVVLNPIEPAPLSIRQPQGVPLQLQVLLRDQELTPVDPDDIEPVLVLLPRSGGATQTYEMVTYDPTNGIASIQIDGGDLKDPLGYSIELYSSVAPVTPFSVATPVGLIAAGTLAIRVGTYGSPG